MPMLPIMPLKKSISIQSINCFVYYFVCCLCAFVICVYLFAYSTLFRIAKSCMWACLTLIHINIIIKWGINLLLFSVNIVFWTCLVSRLSLCGKTIKSGDDEWNDIKIYWCLLNIWSVVPFKRPCLIQIVVRTQKKNLLISFFT